MFICKVQADVLGCISLLEMKDGNFIYINASSLYVLITKHSLRFHAY